MINKFKVYLNYFKYIKENNYVSYKDYFNLFLDDIVKGKEMPVIFSDDGSNVYRVFHVLFINETGILTHKTSVLERPFGISQNDVFSIVSYVKNKLDMLNIPMNRQISIIEKFLIYDFGFKVIDDISYKRVVDLFLFSGSNYDLVKSKFFSDYFNWKVSTVSESDILSIYENSKNKLELRI